MPPDTQQVIKRADLLRIVREVYGDTRAAGQVAAFWGLPDNRAMQLRPRRQDTPLMRAVRQHLNLGPEPVVVEVIADGD